MNDKCKKGLFLGILLIGIAIIIGILFQHDIAFVFAGIGTILIGIVFLAWINGDRKKEKETEEDQK